MNSNDEQPMDTLPRVKAVGAARAPWTVNVSWADGTKDRVDLTGLIHRSRHFRVFLGRSSNFRKVRVAPFGAGIEWENGLDYGADTLKMMADEQRPVSGADLIAFESGLNLSTAETAALLGLAERTVRGDRRPNGFHNPSPSPSGPFGQATLCSLRTIGRLANAAEDGQEGSRFEGCLISMPRC